MCVTGPTPMPHMDIYTRNTPTQLNLTFVNIIITNNNN